MKTNHHPQTSRLGSRVEPRNKPERTIPGVVIRVIDGVGVAVPAGMEHLFAEVYTALKTGDQS